VGRQRGTQSGCQDHRQSLTAIRGAACGHPPQVPIGAHRVGRGDDDCHLPSQRWAGESIACQPAAWSQPWQEPCASSCPDSERRRPERRAILSTCGTGLDGWWCHTPTGTPPPIPTTTCETNRLRFAVGNYADGGSQQPRTWKMDGWQIRRSSESCFGLRRPTAVRFMCFAHLVLRRRVAQQQEPHVEC
jgi:hypothetical protein